MTKREIQRVEKLKAEMVRHKRNATFDSNEEFESLPEYKRRLADQDYGYAMGIYEVLAVLGCVDEYPDFEEIT